MSPTPAPLRLPKTLAVEDPFVVLNDVTVYVGFLKSKVHGVRTSVPRMFISRYGRVVVPVLRLKLVQAVEDLLKVML